MTVAPYQEYVPVLHQDPYSDQLGTQILCTFPESFSIGSICCTALFKIIEQVRVSVHDSIPKLLSHREKQIEEMIQGLTQVPWERVDIHTDLRCKKPYLPALQIPEQLLNEVRVCNVFQKLYILCAFLLGLDFQTEDVLAVNVRV
ncbi:hypothetical protein CK203_087367 [Vitis vinifera]|uniref:Uncharacterized protein n=1 Tax=Vitis vinifera TaxID=29760 RepID=A0A438D2Z3_VITVI|nr:hypothetical protein CK203_087367 [Vitis vinifera]